MPHDPRSYPETEARIIAENETHTLIALRAEKAILRRNLPLIAALAVPPTASASAAAAIAIERLISFVDELDGDADLEESGDLEEAGDAEPWLGAANEGAQVCWARGPRDDREDEHDGCEPDVDDELSGDEDEPSLGSFDRLTNQDHGWRQTQGCNWVAHQNSDLEAEPHGT
ncbi:hypothetical protein [Bradyrhizobium sp. SEMIA]|uniref:hypothetical protein n=1 Tax=Bradyrhizobium sp. SEMIA TaxID=2597515 RepID=UPI0018A33E25|nr:hypothetical protein [Bradyrhizobium sp. SEMIA]QOG20484.1 hypothetical protein FOM02_27140 [Bradyrhizobium sp. SEMIA]